MTFIPNEILLIIFSYLEFGDALALSKICRQWRHLAFAIIHQLPIVIHQNSICDPSVNKGRLLKINSKLLPNIAIWTSQVKRINASAAIASCPLVEFCSYCPKLSFLNLSGLDFISESDLLNIIYSCPSIEHLDLSKCYKLLPSALVLIADSLKKLKYLNISQTQLAAMSSLMDLFNTHGDTLVGLEMTQAILLGEQDWITVFDVITNTCTKIEKLDFSYNCLLTDYALDKLNIKSRKLEINLTYCDQLSIKAVSDTVKRCNHNLIIHHNARIPDYTPDGIRSYIQYLIGQ